MYKLIVVILLTGCASAVSTSSRPVSLSGQALALNPVTNSTPSPETSGPIIPNVDYPRILNGQIQGSFNIDGTLKDHRVVCKKTGGVWDYDDNECCLQGPAGRLDISFGTETYLLNKGDVDSVKYIEVGEGNKITFVYSSIGPWHRNKWLEYFYERYGEPIFHYQNNEKTYSSREWQFDNGVVEVADRKLTAPFGYYNVAIVYIKEIKKPECKIAIMENQHTYPFYLYIDGKKMVVTHLPINATVSCGVHNVILEKFQVDGGEKKHELVETTHFAPAIVTVDFE